MEIHKPYNNFTFGKNRNIIPGFLLLFILITLACSGISSVSPANDSRRASPTPTPTPTPVIFAQELSATPPVNDGAIWIGKVTSNTARQYMSQGKVLNTCTTDWVTDVTMLVDSSGHVTGDARGSLMTPRHCTLVTNLEPNLTGYTLKVGGVKTDKEFNIQFTLVSSTPAPPAGEFGGYSLLFAHASCDFSPRMIPVTLTSPTTAGASPLYSEVMTGCGGSKDDIMSSENSIEFSHSFDCKNKPSDLNDPEINKLCQ
jgi:hypothetical protein